MSAKPVQKLEWMDHLKKINIVLRYGGLWPIEKSTSMRYVCYSLFVKIFIMTGHNLSQIIKLFQVDNIDGAAGIFFIASTNILAQAKCISFGYYLKSVNKICSFLERKDFQITSEKQLISSKTAIRYWVIFYCCGFTIVTINCLLWVTTPLFTKERDLPFVAWYPFDWTQSPFFELTYIYQIVGIFYLTLSNSHFDFFFWYMVTMSYCQCAILIDKLASLDINKKKLVGLIKEHQAKLEFVDQFNKVFGVYMMGQFLTSASGLSLAVYQLYKVSEFNSEFAAALCYVFGLTIEIFAPCTCGSILKEEFNLLPDNVYNTNWADQPHELKKNVQVLLVNCQRPVEITAMGLFPLTLDLVIRICKSAWSFFTMLVQAK